jgi:phage major head subunit gpT-like protein
MGNLNNVLQELNAERKQAQLNVEKLDKAISVIESLNGTGASQQANQPTRVISAPSRVISAASRRKMATSRVDAEFD